MSHFDPVAGTDQARLRRVEFDALPGWSGDDHAASFSAFRRSAEMARERHYRTGRFGVEIGGFEPAFSDALANLSMSGADARTFFEHHFAPVHVMPLDRDANFVTGYYEPVVAASAVRTDDFTIPILSRPPDLVEINDDNRPDGFDPYLAFGRPHGSTIAEYHDRAAIERGALDHYGLAIAWLQSRIDAFFIHVQGSARLQMIDGREVRVTYAAKSGHRFTGAGQVLVELGEMRREDVTMQSIRAWLAAHPDRLDDILWRNRSYIFFREAPPSSADGPIGAAKVPLTAGRSIAIDRLLHTFSTPFFISAPSLTAFGQPFARLMVAQDTGSAIVGPARADLFVGTGHAAGEIAGVIKHDADFYMLLPRGRS